MGAQIPGGGPARISRLPAWLAAPTTPSCSIFSTSYIQRRLQIGYNRAASLMEKMEQEGVVGAANHAGKREILAGPPPGI